MGELPFSDHSYERFLEENKLMGAKCQNCGSLYTPPRPICIQCHGSKMEWIEMKGHGRLAAFTCIGIGPPFMAAEGYDRNNPYCSCVVELDEGVKVDARLEGVDTANPETIRVGMPLTVKFLHRRDDNGWETYLAFVPAGDN